MYLVFDASLSELAKDTFSRIQSEYQYGSKKEGSLTDTISSLDEALVVTDDLEAFQSSPDYRRTVLEMMSKGAVFFSESDIEKPKFEDDFSVDNPHFINLTEIRDGVDPLDHALESGIYAENKVKFFEKEFPKIEYLGSTFADPLAIVVLGKTRKEPEVDIRKQIVDSLPEDFWGSIAYVSSYRTETLVPLLEHLPYSAVLTVDKKMTDRVESLGRPVHNIGTPDGTEKYGVSVRNIVETQE